MAKSQIYWDSSRGTFVDEDGNPVSSANSQYSSSSTNPKNQVYSPDVESAYDLSDDALSQYFSSLEKPDEVGDLSKYLTDVGAYQGYDWENPLDDYNAPTYEALSGYTRPEFERTTYSDPTIDEIESVSPIAQELYDTQEAKARAEVARGFKDTRTQILDEVYRNRNRPQQAAALLAELGVKENSSRQSTINDIRFAQAEQELGIAQTEQSLGQQRSTNLANMKLTSEQSTAAERQAAAEYLMGAEQYEQGEKKYAYEQELGDAQYQMGVKQWLQEQKAAEEQTKYQSQYALAQDTAQTKLQEYDTNRSANLDYSNAMLQGQQAAAQQFSQAGTYNTNLSEKEREKARVYAASKNSGATTATSLTSNSAYKMPNTTRTSNTTSRRSAYA